MAQIHELTMIELAAAIRAGELSPVAVTDHYLRRTTELNDQVGAFYTVTPEFAADQAREAEKAVAAADDVAELPPLTGVPIPIKDLNMVAGVRQTLGSKAFEANVPDTDDYVVVNIKQAGAVITGKTATPEFGLPCYTETAVGPPARTPWDLSRSAGGSSGAGFNRRNQSMGFISSALSCFARQGAICLSSSGDNCVCSFRTRQRWL
jgi:amidase